MRPVKLNLMLSKGLQNGNRVFISDTPGVVADEDDTTVGRQDLDLDEDESPPTSNMLSARPFSGGKSMKIRHFLFNPTANQGSGCNSAEMS